MPKDQVLMSENGELTVQSDSNREEPDFISWRVTAGSAYGVVANSAKLRTFLRRALKRLDADVDRRKKRRAI